MNNDGLQKPLPIIYEPLDTFMPYEITDDSGFLAIVDPDAYQGFVHADWTLEMIQQHFIHEMRERHLLIWHTGLEHVWRVDVSLARTGQPVLGRSLAVFVRRKGGCF